MADVLPRRPIPLAWLSTLFLAVQTVAAHDIPNARVDRSVQVILRAGRIDVEYEVSLGELTLTQDLQSLIGTLRDGDRTDWFRRYGVETSPLNARGLLIEVDGHSIDLMTNGFDLVVEEHPRFTFHFTAVIPGRGSLRLIDSNYAESQGSSRLAVRSEGDVAIDGYQGPADVHSIPIPILWKRTPVEERSGHRLDLDYRSGSGSVAEPERARAPEARTSFWKLDTLFDRADHVSWAALGFAAYFLGLLHAIQPGHGKTLVAAALLGPEGGRWRGVTVGLAASAGHMISVSILAMLLWMIGPVDYPAWNALVVHTSGFALAIIGAFRLGRVLGSSRASEAGANQPEDVRTGLLALGFAAGIVPCWDAITLLVVSAALGRLALGVSLIAAFSLGMATVLAVVGLLSSRLIVRNDASVMWSRGLSIVGGGLLFILGVTFMGA